MGQKGSVHSQPWPEYDPELIQEDRITLIIQINGKVRDKVEVGSGISKDKAKKLTLEREKVKQGLLGKKIQKIVFVPNKLINIVI